jgi:hypothetical protein
VAGCEVLPAMGALSQVLSLSESQPSTSARSRA